MFRFRLRGDNQGIKGATTPQGEETMKKKWIIIVIAVMLAACIALVACDSDSSSSTNPSNPFDAPGNSPFTNPGDSLGGGGQGTIPDETESANGDVVSATDVSDLQDSESIPDGATVIEASDEQVVIDVAGDYVLSGEYSQGIVVSVANNETTHIYLNGATITNTNGIAISNTNKKSSLIITVVDGTTNVVTNAGDDANAIHVKGNLSINGSGTLSVTSASKSAIKVSKSFVVIDATVNIDSANHGIAARSIEAQNATINVTSAAKDGLNAECDDDTTEFPSDYSEGYVKLIDTTYACNVYGDGIQADTLVYIDGGNIDIKTNGVFVKYSSDNMTTYDLEADDFRYILSNGTYQKIASDSNYSTSRLYALTQSCKGIKVGEIKYEDADGNEVAVTDGDYLIVIKGDVAMNIDSTDDAIHTNSGGVLVKGGDITINTYDDGITSDYLTQIDGGNIVIQSSYEGIEGAYVKITGGNIDITSSDDGINAASDDTSISEYIVINGGYIVVNASGDGLDSNGSILITDGTVIVYGPTSGGDAGMDADSGIIIQGGYVFVSSSLGMVETPSQNSTQYVLSYAQNSTIASGTVLTIKNSDGNEICSVEIKKDCQSIIISVPEFESGATYTINSGSTQLASFTISGTITSVGSSVSSGGPGGPGGQGGQGGRPGGGFGRP